MTFLSLRATIPRTSNVTTAVTTSPLRGRCCSPVGRTRRSRPNGSGYQIKTIVTSPWRRHEHRSSPLGSWNDKFDRSFHFATPEYASCFVNLPEPDPAYFRHQAVEYLRERYDPQLWYGEPICSILRGEKLVSGDVRDTHDALGRVNGKQMWSTAEELDAVREHVRAYQSQTNDQRDLIRQVEEDIMTHHAGFLIGNQCVDFAKQDGVTEIEEAVMANTMERRLNDQLLAAESRGEIVVDRSPIYVACVSNFSHFLDLSRKTLRSLEVGIPVIILGRSQTSQHVFRWTELLIDLAVKQHGMEAGMITYLNGSIDDLQRVLRDCSASTGNLYATCSRELAATLKENYPRTVASTGGPNTLVVTSNIATEKEENDQDNNVTVNNKGKGDDEGNSNSTTEATPPASTTGVDSLTKAVQAAIRTSAAIESAGQCTALRHCVVPKNTSDETLETLWMSTTTVQSSKDALDAGQFDGVFAHNATPKPSPDEYQHPPDQPNISYKVSDKLPDGPMNEYWRQVAVDFTKLDLANSPEDRQALCAWLNQHQPISLAINGPRTQVLEIGLELFNHTGLVVYTLGSTDSPNMPPALTCQARPQDGEVFGEFPPRSDATKYSMFPVIIPSSNPSYGATYTAEYLRKQQVDPYWSTGTQKLVQAVQDDLVRGYIIALLRYLQAVDVQNPRVGRTSNLRTSLWGLQRPPLGQSSHLYVTADASWDAVAPIFIMYYITKARDQMILTLHPENKAVQQICEGHNIPYHMAEQSEWQSQVDVQSDAVFLHKVVDGTSVESSFPMVGLYALQYFPAGHIKSTSAHDDEFLFRIQGLSQKWLKTLF